MLLTAEQKTVFSQWLDRQIFSSQAIESQFAKLPARIAEEMVKKERLQQVACKVVLRMINDGEVVTMQVSETETSHMKPERKE